MPVKENGLAIRCMISLCKVKLLKNKADEDKQKKMTKSVDSSLSSTADIYINVDSDAKIDIIDYTAQDGCPNSVIFNFIILGLSIN
jgi:hypothetical protein